MAHEIKCKNGLLLPLLTNSYDRLISVGANGLVKYDDFNISGSFVATKASHGYTSLELYKPINIAFGLSKADTEANVETIGILSEIIDGDTLRIKHTGKLYTPAHGLTVGQVYFVSAVTAGLYVATAPSVSGQFLKPILRILDANNIEVIDYPAVEVGTDADYYVVTPPASSSSSGIRGQWSYSSGYMYKAVDINTWVKWAVITSF